MRLSFPLSLCFDLKSLSNHLSFREGGVPSIFAEEKFRQKNRYFWSKNANSSPFLDKLIAKKLCYDDYNDDD